MGRRSLLVPFLLLAASCSPFVVRDDFRIAREATRERFPPVPDADASFIDAPAGYQVEAFLTGLSFPTSLEEDETGNLYIAEAGAAFGKKIGPARVIRLSTEGKLEVVARDLKTPLTSLLMAGNKLFIAHGDKISFVPLFRSITEDKKAPPQTGAVTDVLTGLPSLGEHPIGQLALGPGGKDLLRHRQRHELRRGGAR